MTLLLLAGTGEARAIAECPCRRGDPGRGLAGRGHAATGRAGGSDPDRWLMAMPPGSASICDAAGITAVLDATHPFADRMSQRSCAVATRAGAALRPVPAPRMAARARGQLADAGIGTRGGRPYPARRHRVSGHRAADTGKLRQSAGSPPDLSRQIDPPERPFPFPGGEYRIGRPPFSVEDEVALFRELGVDWLVVKNAGGVASRSKLDAARQLGIPVAMIRTAAAAWRHQA